MTTLYERAYAKVNLTLDVLGKRTDGYHDLCSVMQTISLCDEITIRMGTGKDWVLSCSKDGIPTDSRNLAWKAAKVFLDAAGKDPNGIEIHINKNIPSEAGLGGGSADAAAVLRALNNHYNQPFSIQELASLGAAVGSDVPFCTVGGTAMVEGRGEHVRSLPDMPKCAFVVCKPDFSASTPALYRKLDEIEIADRPDNVTIEQAISRGDLNQVAASLCNVFEPAVGMDYPELYHIKDRFSSLGAMAQLMSGSGSSVFALVKDMGEATEIYRALEPEYPNLYIAEPV